MTTLVFIIILLMLASLALAARSLAPWVPMRSKDLSRVFTLAKLRPGAIFYDLGCGNGKVVLSAAKYYQAKAIGLELAWPLYMICLLRKLWRREPNAKFYCQNIFKCDFTKADVIYVFGMPKTLSGKLAPLLKKQLQPGAKVISYVFPIATLQATLIDKPGSKDNALYLYQF